MVSTTSDPEELRAALSLFRQQLRPADVLAELASAWGDEWTSEGSQQLFVRHVLHNPATARFPPTQKYLWSLCKAYMRAIESCGAGVDDDLMEIGLSFQPKPDDLAATLGGMGRNLEYSFKCYPLEGTIYGIKVWPEFSQVGLALWPAGFALADWVMLHREELQGANIVELGSGVGLTGIVAAATCKETGRVVMTDYLETVNNNTRENIQIAGFADAVSVEDLDWEKVQAGDEAVLSRISGYDTTCLLAADVVYDREVIPALSDTFAAFLERSPRLRHIVFAVTHRNEETFQYLLQQLLRNGLALESSSFPQPSGTFVYDASLIKIYSLTRGAPPSS